MESVDEEAEDVAVLLAERVDGGEHALDEAAAALALCPERQLAEDDGVTKGALGLVVGRLDSGVVDEGPEGVAVLEDRQGLALRVDARGQRVSVLPTRPGRADARVIAGSGSGAERESAVGIGGELRADVVALGRGSPVDGGEVEDLVLGPARQQAQQVA